MTYCFLILLLVLAKYNLLPFEINSKGNTSFTLAFINLKISELLFNMNNTLPERVFPISTVHNKDHIRAHHISKKWHDPTVEWNGICQRPKLPYRVRFL